VTWHPNLASWGYGEPLPPSIPVVQATLVAMLLDEIQHFIQISDLEALDKNGASDNGEVPIFSIKFWRSIVIFIL